MPDPTTHRAAGILFVTPQGKALFLKRGPGGDAPGSWCFPGGTTEGDETPEETAKREATEELGKYPAGNLTMHCRTLTPVQTLTPMSVSDDVVDFTTFAQKVDAEFAPTLNGEHTGWAWADTSLPPEPLHPGCKVALDKMNWDELGVARAMRDGLLTSPQRYANVWLFDMRITGTGVSYRGPKYGEDGEEVKAEEFVYRRPENYLTDEFLQRCNGLAVIMMHPAKALLNSKEFGARVVGAFMLPYIKGDEVWGIAKVYDDGAAEAMMSKQMSTSPAVLLSGDDHKLKTEDGTDLLIEGKPSLLDHLAICERGVWDKGGDPSGVRTDNQTGEYEMDKAEITKLIQDGLAAGLAALKVDLASTTSLTRADAVGDSKLDQILAAVGGFGKRVDEMATRLDAFEKKVVDKKDSDDDKKMDADMEKMDGESDEDFEKRKKDAADEKAKDDAEDEEKSIAADKAKKDADEKERKDAEEKEKADAAVRAENEVLRKRLDVVERGMPKQLTDADRQAFATAQARADDVCQGFGRRAKFPLNGEDVLPYRKRLVNELKEHSPTWKDVDVFALADSAFEVAESQVFKEARVAAMNPTDLRDDELRAIVRVDEDTGVRTTSFVGRHSFVRSMTRPSRRVTHIGARKET